jgi:hypothetical protein
MVAVVVQDITDVVAVLVEDITKVVAVLVVILQMWERWWLRKL